MGGYFQFFTKNRPQKHQKRAILHTSQANGGGSSPPAPPGYATGERVWRIVAEDLGMMKICSKMVLKLLNEGQKELRVQVCQDILEQLETEPNLLKRVVTGNEP